MSRIRDAVAGVKWGLGAAGVLCAWVTVVALVNLVVNGSLTLRGRGQEYHILAIIAAYVVGGAVTGAIVGALRPLLRWKFGAAVVGAMAAVPLVGITVARSGFTSWEAADTFGVVFGALVLGGGGGLILRAFLLEGVGETTDEGRRKNRQ
jgi:hypothetical protein